MGRVKSLKAVNPFVICQIFFLSIAFSSFSQTKQSYRNHEEIDVGGGMKVEILKCYGEGPAEECDCIYFTDKRQNGTRMKQNANRIKEEERAANIARGIMKPTQRKTAGSSNNPFENRADKSIPKSLTERVNPNKKTAEAILTEAARKADSAAKASSQKMKENLSRVAAADDSASMDQVFIPKVTETGGTRLESSNPNPIPQNTNGDTSTGTITGLSDSAVIDSSIAATPDANNTAKEPGKNVIEIRDTTAVGIPVTGKHDTIAKETPINIKENAVVNVTVAPGVVKDNEKANDTTAVKDSVAAGSNVLADSLAKTMVNIPPVSTISSVDTGQNTDAEPPENSYVKSYQNVKPTAEPVAQVLQNAPKEELKAADSVAVVDTTEPLTAPVALKPSLKSTDTIEMKVPEATNKSVGRKEDKAKKQASKVEQKSNAKSASLSSVITSPGIRVESLAKDSANLPVTINASQSALTDTLAVKVDAYKENMPETSIVATPTDIGVPAKDSTGAVLNVSVRKNSEEKVNLETGINSNTLTTDRTVVGKSAEVNTKGQWEKVTIIDKETELLYKVHYRGRSADYDEWVPITQIRNIDSSKAPPTPSNKSINNKTSEKPGNIPKVHVNCSFEAPAPPVSNAAQFSERLAKRKIYEYYVSLNKDDAKKMGVTFLSMVAETPYVNTVSISATNNLEVKFSFAPAGAMIYPVQTQFKVCEQVLGKTSSKTLTANYGCFRNKEGAWACANVE